MRPWRASRASVTAMGGIIPGLGCCTVSGKLFSMGKARMFDAFALGHGPSSPASTPIFALMSGIPSSMAPAAQTLHATAVRVVNKGRHPLPAYATAHSAGLDLRANLDAPITLAPGEYRMVPTGLYLELPEGTEAQVRPRSGLAFKHGVTVLNAPGTIDADYRGEVGVLLINHGRTPFVVNDGERVAQLVVSRYERIRFEERTELGTSERGTGGFGHTGTR